MFKIVAIALAVLFAAIVLVIGIAMTRPDAARIERTARIEAPPEAIFAMIEDFRQWRVWSPYERLDPALKRDYAGAPRGKGAIYAWEGAKAGAGRMEIVEVDPARRIVIKLDFRKPFEAHHIAEFTLTPGPNDTEIRWAMHGRSPLASKVMGLFVNLDRLIGKDFEAGLANLKAAAEGGTTPAG